LSATAPNALRDLAKVDMLRVTYKDDNLALNDQGGGRIDLVFYTL
jgi:hypothetical protein